jgi:hypothetical protein
VPTPSRPCQRERPAFAVSFIGLDPIETTVHVTAGQTVTKDIQMSSQADAGSVV